MNFLNGVRRLRQECGIPGTGPITTLAQTGELKRLVDWYAQALIEIQLEEVYWQFLRSDFSFNTIANKQSYSYDTDIGITDYGHWRNDSFRIYQSSPSNEIFLTQYNYNSFRDFYLYGTKATTYSRPNSIAIAPDDSLVLGLPPNDIYTVRGEYYKAPVEVALDDDIPILPERFHMIIVYAAMMKYGSFEAAAEVYNSGKELYRRYMSRMRSVEAPTITTGSSLI